MEREGNLAHYEHRLRQAEDEVAGIALQMELSRATADLHGHPGWEKLMDRLRGIEAGEIERLRDNEMSPYDLGRRQGRLLALRSLTAQKPLSEDEVANLRAKVTILTDSITEYRNLLN